MIYSLYDPALAEDVCLHNTGRLPRTHCVRCYVELTKQNHAPEDFIHCRECRRKFEAWREQNP